MKLLKIIMLYPAVLMLNACTDSTDYNFETSQMLVEETAALGAPATPDFDLQSVPPNLPFPNMLLFSGSEDGTLNIPLGETAADDLTSPTVALNNLDGFSTTQAITASFGASEMDAASFVLGETVRVFEVVATQEGAVTAITTELTAADVIAQLVGPSTLAILPPLKPLKESTDYMVIVTSGVKNANGVATGPSPSFRLIAGSSDLTETLGASAEAIRQLTNTYLVAAEGAGVPRSSVILAWGVRTQSITPTLSAVKSASGAGTIVTAASGFTTKQLLDPDGVNPGITGSADVHIGTLDLPYYRTAPASANDSEGVTSFWQGIGGSNLSRFNPMPVATSTQTVPVLMTVPNAASGKTQPAAGWPIAIFAHGIGGVRTHMLAIAEAMAAAGFAVVAIDQPMHGITDPTNALSASASPFPTDIERTFNLDLVDANGAAGPDGIPDATGFHFYSPGNLLASRDNLRQGAADLFVLSASVGDIPSVQINAAAKTLIGFSLGGAVATTFLAFDDSIQAATLAMPAAGLAPLLLASEAYRDTLIAGLAAVGVVENTPEFQQLILVAQTVIDSGDSINHAAQAAENAPVHIMEVVGDGAEVPPDATVPNNVPTAPLSGTDPLARLMGFTPQTAITADTAGPGLVRFKAGNHSSLLNPAASLAATIEMQKQVATFAASFGTFIDITDTSVISGAE